MSASEKLRSLDRHPELLGLADVVLLLSALPLIADVVEAAEDDAVFDIFDDNRMYPAHQKLAAALTALQEHLDG